MFDIGFFELLVIGVIALLVLGPERLPHAVRMVGAWMGKFRRAATSVREEIEREVNAYEMQQRIKEQLEQSGVSETKDMLEKTKQTLRNGILDEDTLKEIERRGLGDYAKSLTEPDSASEEVNTGSEADDKPDSKKIRDRNHQQTANGTASAPPAPPSSSTTDSESPDAEKGPDTDNQHSQPDNR